MAEDLPPIEKNIPIPPNSGNRKYGFDRLEVGDSIFIKDVTSAKDISSCTTHFFKKTGRKLVTRRETGGVRVWRVK